ncbi:hypothetical protein ALQ73_200206 [Pseudomonas savastanoi pv. glycinea]|uniref:Uncharacterized protein n=1 Tax=Pseudomonas savastanoi pv. glycinea TaxID=318 RepID=A0A3M3G7J1_PSESG|nr:hypothetical protein ALQ73_200206 [Pseudomonas savastanoi pv. glycinea]
MATNQPAYIEPALFLFSSADQLKRYEGNPQNSEKIVR